VSVLLILRPEPGASKTVARAAALGLEAISYPLFTIEACRWTGPAATDFDALLMTSGNAARHGGPDLARYAGLPSYAVGSATAAAMAAAGFRDMAAGDADGASVARRIAADGHRRVLHLCGADVRPFESGALRLTRIAVYAAMESGSVAGLTAIMRPGMVLLVHSPRAGRRIAAMLPMSLRRNLHLVAISAAALVDAGPGWASAQAVAEPVDDAMLALAAGLCK
jgi:uroporphyrinogen-III synthase